MSGMDNILICLGILAMTSGQGPIDLAQQQDPEFSFFGGNNGWGGGNQWGGNQWGGNQWGGNQWGGNQWGAPQMGNQAITATCRNTDATSLITVLATIKRRFNGWTGYTPELDITASMVGGPNSPLTLNLVMTSLGATDNTGGCTAANLGDIIVPRQSFSPFMPNMGMANGVLRMITVTNGVVNPQITITNLPIKTLAEAFGAGLVLCQTIQEINNVNMQPAFPFMRPPQRRFRCMDGTAPWCCKLGRFDGAAM